MKSFLDYCALKETVNLLDESLFDSKTLFAEMAVLNPNAINKMQSALQFIKNYNIEGVIIGGMAVSHWTVDRKLTPDVDFLTKNIAQVKELCQSQQLPFQPLASDGNFDGINVPMIDADFLDANQGNVPLNQYIMRTAVQANVGGVSFKIIDPAVLTIMKFTLSRNKDMEDGFNLLKIVDKDSLKNHLKMLKNFLGGNIDARTIWSYAQAL